MMADSESMNQEQAKELFDNGGTLVFLDVPERTEFGIDFNSWTVGPKFKGVKMIPPGVHFIYYSAVDCKEKQVAPRTGFFHDFKSKEVLIKKWNKLEEDISMIAVTQQEQEDIELNKQNIDRFLGGYPYENYNRWVSLTNYLSADMINTLQPSSRRICSVSEFQSKSSTSQSRKEAAKLENEAESGASVADSGATPKVDTDGLPFMEKIPGTEFKFTPIEKRKYPEGSTVAEISQHSMDYSYFLNKIIDERYGGDSDRLLAELQFAFVCFMVGQVYDSFEQWKLLVNVFCFSEQALASHTELFSRFITAMHFHIREVPPDFFVDIVAQNNFLVVNLRTFFRNVRECGQVALMDKSAKFQKHLEAKFGWDLVEDEDDEDAPLVVELIDCS